MKKAVGIISLALCAVFVQPANAADEKVIAIIDSALDSSKFTNIKYEVCFTGNSTCPNGKTFQEGTGSATTSNFKASGMEHGYNVTYVASKTNPNIKIVFIRIADLASGTNVQIAYTQGQSLDNAIDWVAKNAAKYSIDAVSISQSRSNFTGACPTDKVFETSVKVLADINVATFAATGNDSKKNQIGFPSCVAGVYSVGAIDSNGNIASYSNTSSDMKLAAIGCIGYTGTACNKFPDYAGVLRATSGTSIATPIAVSKLLNVWNGENWATFINALPKKYVI